MFSPAGVITVVRVFGDVDLSTVHVLQAAFREARQRRPGHLVVDVAGMGFCSVLGLAQLADAGPEPAGPRAEYLLSGVQPHLERYLNLLWSAGTLPVRYPSVGAAVLAAMAHQRVRRGRDRPIRHAVRHPARTPLRGGVERQHRARIYRRALQMLGSPEEDDNAKDVAIQLRRALAPCSEVTLL